jgi:hypothetical protein
VIEKILNEYEVKARMTPPTILVLPVVLRPTPYPPRSPTKGEAPPKSLSANLTLSVASRKVVRAATVHLLV